MKKCVVVGIRNSYRIEIEEYLSDDYEIIAYSDLKIEELDCKHINFRPLLKMNEIVDVAFDYILIAYKNAELAKHTREVLTRWQKIPSELILEFYKWAYIEFPSLLEVWRESQKSISYDGIIVGMSHAAVGIDVNYFEQKIYGGGYGSADASVMRMCLKSMLAVNNSVRRVPIEIPYYFFNWNIKYSSYYYRIFPIITDEGVVSETKEAEENVVEYFLFERLFRNKMQRNTRVYTTIRSKRLETRNKLSYEEICNQAKDISHVWTKHFEEIERNTKIFEEMINEIKFYNEKMEIQIIVMPQNPIFIEENAEVIGNMKQKFYNCLMPMCEKYKITLFDYFDMYTGKKDYFYDICHLNPKGRAEFSKIIAREVLAEE